jgi:hexosaminidase
MSCGHPFTVFGRRRLPRSLNPFSSLLSLLTVGIAICFLAAYRLAAAPSIIPLPAQMVVQPGNFSLCPNQPVPQAAARATRKILVDGPSLQTGQYLAMMLSRSTGFQFDVATNGGAGPIRGAILLTTVNALGTLGAEGYELTVAPDSVVIRAPAQAGVFYGVQSFLQLFPPQILSIQAVTNMAWTAQCVYIQDQPRFVWRGVMLDVSRHFEDKQEVERVLDGLALHKINTFHWHLTDDHGWRIQITNSLYPNLTLTASTNTGAWRTGIDYGQNPAASTAWNSLGKYGGFYTQNDIREVVAYAQQRHITIVPELEFPAHCSAALVSYPSLGCGNPGSDYNMDNINYGFTLFSLAGPGSWAFFTNTLNEVINLFPGQYIHCGGDEVVATGDQQWKSYSYDVAQLAILGINTSSSTWRQQYQYWFSTNLASFLQSKGRTMVGWSEIEAAGTITNAVLMDWLGSYTGQTASNRQYVVVAPNGINYYEMTNANTLLYEPYFQVGSNPATNSVANVYNTEPVPANLNSAYKSYILGAQVNLWTEFVPSGANVEYKMFPRVCAEAEMTWTPKAQKNLSDFYARLLVDEQRLAAMGLNYNHENITQIGSWGPSVPTTPTTVNYDITPYVNKGGEVDVSFSYTSGSDGINVYSVALLEAVNNGGNWVTNQVDMNTFTSFAGLGLYGQTGNSLGGVAYYAVHLPWYHPGSSYVIQASMAEHGSSASSSGNVYLPNWN